MIFGGFRDLEERFYRGIVQVVYVGRVIVQGTDMCCGRRVT